MIANASVLLRLILLLIATNKLQYNHLRSTEIGVIAKSLDISGLDWKQIQQKYLISTLLSVVSQPITGEI